MSVLRKSTRIKNTKINDFKSNLSDTKENDEKEIQALKSKRKRGHESELNASSEKQQNKKVKKAEEINIEKHLSTLDAQLTTHLEKLNANFLNIANEIRVLAKLLRPSNKNQLETQKPSSESNPSINTNKDQASNIDSSTDNDKLAKIADKYSSFTACASALAVELFTDQELKSKANVSGRPSNGKRNILDPKRISIIKNLIMKKVPNSQDKDDVWKSCVNAIHKKQSKLRRLH